MIPTPSPAPSPRRWNPTGREIYYRNGQSLVAVPFEASGAEPTFGRPTPLFADAYAFGQGTSIPNYDVTADGHRAQPLADRGRVGPQVQPPLAAAEHDDPPTAGVTQRGEVGHQRAEPAVVTDRITADERARNRGQRRRGNLGRLALTAAQQARQKEGTRQQGPNGSTAHYHGLSWDR